MFITFTETFWYIKLKKLFCLLNLLIMQRKVPVYYIHWAIKWESSKWLKLIGQHETWVDAEEKAQGD